MIDFINQHEPVLRGLVFAASLGLLAVFEIAFPRRFLGARLARWRTNFLLGGANMFLLRVVLPGGLVALAYTGYGGGVFGWLELPLWVEIFISLIILDFVIYAQHMALHHIPFLWPLHATHHAEQTLDVSSGLRFHPGEALVSLGVKAVAVLALGVHPAAVIIFEILLSSTSLFTHTNLDLGRWDARLQALFVSPDMHRLHHSRAADESRANFGFCLSVWDKVFKTYRATPHTPHETLPLGLTGFRQGGLIEALRHPLRHIAKRP
ncbi:MAG TPA: hypothetical protein DCP12_01730 [Rhodobiaceae bacterium]|jgi:sterol desaturase/sphingolipid hydroxylase (fatty acid hydroxylase superfamily)|nr:hypothetical protein [Rhodobiaceae bacterium]